LLFVVALFNNSKEFLAFQELLLHTSLIYFYLILKY